MKPKICGIIAVILSIILINPITASAEVEYKYVDREYGSGELGFYFYGLPEEAEYVDLLLKFSEKDPRYVESNISNMEQLTFDKKILSDYKDDDFVSFSAHYSDIKTDMIVSDDDKKSMKIFQIADYSSDLNYFFRNTYYEVKLIVFDGDGNVISTSDEFSIQTTDSDQVTGPVVYKVDSDIIRVKKYSKELGYKRNKEARKATIMLFLIAADVIITLIIILVVIINYIIKKSIKK